ncbi:MAG: nuclear transport factor 2 family protein [Chloroflexota bacterium]|nr:nuclear transport factor 2 family protein [Chloroflexota bacterium]
MVGSPAIEGKAAFAEATSMAEGPSPDLSITNVITHGRSAAVEGAMTMVDESGTPKTYAFCDVYRMSGSKNRKIKAITAYMIELDAGAAS